MGQGVAGPDGASVGNVVDAMFCSNDGRLQTLLVSHGGGVGGIGERIVMLERGQFDLTPAGVKTSLDPATLAALPKRSRPDRLTSSDATPASGRRTRRNP